MGVVIGTASPKKNQMGELRITGSSPISITPCPLRLFHSGRNGLWLRLHLRLLGPGTGRTERLKP
jgi:hypothetical protein